MSTHRPAVQVPRAASPGSSPGAAALAQHARVLQQFRVVFNAVKTHFQQVERQAGVGGSQVSALSVILDRPGIGVSELAAALNVRQPTASLIVRNLARQALVEACRDAADRRSVQLRTTAAGRKVLRRAPGPFAGVLPDALQSLQPATLDLLEQGLCELVAVLGADEQAEKMPLSDLSG